MTEADERELELGFVDGSLSRDERETVLARMQGDAAVRADYESLKAVARALETMPEEAPPADFAARFMATHARPSLLERVKALFEGAPAPAIPALAVAGALGCALFFMGGGEPAAPLSPLAGCTLVADAGEARVNDAEAPGRMELRVDDSIEVGGDFQGALVYPDGTRVKIRAGSTLVVRARGIYLQEGSVWLNVTRDQRGFQVDTPIAMAAVKGTRFLVDLADGVMKVVVTEGLVQVVSELAQKLIAAGKAAIVGSDQQIEVVIEDKGSHRMFDDARAGDFAVPGN